jgi:gliding motility-associated-like protein
LRGILSSIKSMVRSLASILSFSLVSGLMATHIIGGEIYYAHQGGDQYLFTLKLFRDCGPNNVNGTGYDPSAELGIFDGSGNYLFSEFIPFPGATAVPVVLNNPCLTAPASICVEAAEYSTVLTLPAIPGGYWVSYQRCCRTPSILNVIAPDDQGLTCTVAVPDANLVGANSSPVFSDYPPIALCVGQNMVFDNSATDADGDQLVYELCTPYNGGDPLNALPSPPSGPPYQFIPWAAGYSQNFPMDAAPPLAIDPVTGELTVTPSQIGSYVVGVCVKEFRNGVMLSEVRRDFRFDAVACVITVLSSIQQQQIFCDGYTVNMVNQSIGGSSYLWDFGVPGTGSDTSSLTAPSYVYPDTGIYSVMLVVNPGWPCSDTSFASFQIYPPLAPSFVPPPVQCLGGPPVPLAALGNFTNTANVQWDLGVNANPGQAQGPQVQANFTQPGTHLVTLTLSDHGCTENYTDTILVFPPPVPVFTTDTAGCTALSVTFDNQSTAWTPMRFLWDLGDGSTSTDSTPTHVYTDPGIYDVRLEVSTDSGCIATVPLWRQAVVKAWVQPVAGLYVTDPVVSVLDPEMTIHDASQGATTWIYTVEGLTYTEPTFTHPFDEAGTFDITQLVTSGLGCVDSARISVIVTGSLFFAPNAFTPDGDGVNDVFLPRVVGAREYDLAVFDRWGERIFHTQDPKAGWDGGAGVIGVYVYKAWLAEHGPERFEFVGTVTLVR